ncbi:hypothetical protein ACLOJK_015461 [Asimina triloba]
MWPPPEVSACTPEKPGFVSEGEMGSEEEGKEAEYHSKDFEWEELRAQVENNPSLSYHFAYSTTTPASTSHDEDSQAWKSFHKRHSSGRFFKERRYLLKEFPELISCGDFPKVLEVGCGNGSTVLPILREALENTREMVDSTFELSIRHRFLTFFCDLSVSGFPSWLKSSPIRASQCLAGVYGANMTDVEVNYDPVSSEFSAFQGSPCCIDGVDFVTLGIDGLLSMLFAILRLVQN